MSEKKKPWIELRRVPYEPPTTLTKADLDLIRAIIREELGREEGIPGHNWPTPLPEVVTTTSHSRHPISWGMGGR